MDSRRHIRPLLALFAAYAIALQALVAGMALGVRSGQAALLAGNGFCLTDPSHPDHAPLERMPCCIGGACCQAGGEPGALPQPAGVAPRLVERLAFFAVAPAGVHTLALDGQTQPRAPPAV